MKWILAAVALCNLVAFYWFTYQLDEDPTVATEQQPPRSGISSLTLINSSLDPAPDELAASSPQNKEALEHIDCWELGPVIEESIIRRLAGELSNFGMSIATRHTGLMAQAGYWVYIPPLASAEDIAAKKLELKAKAIDNFVFRDGLLKNGISLGYFNSYENADIRLSELTSIGIEAKLESSENIASSFWAVLPVEALESLSREFWLEMAKLNPKLKVKAVACGTEDV